MRFVFTEQHRRAYRVRVICQAPGVPASGYDRSRKRPALLPQRHYRRFRATIRTLLGAHRLTCAQAWEHEALRPLEVTCGPVRVKRLAQQEGLRTLTARQFRQTTRAAAAHPTAPNVLNRTFTVAAPTTTAVGDITYQLTEEGCSYVAVISDLQSRQVVEWATGERSTEGQAHAALQPALSRRSIGNDPLHHTEGRIEYTSAGYQRRPQARGLGVSTNWDGNRSDIGVTTRPSARSKVGLAGCFPSRALAHGTLFDYLETFYNRIRIHLSSGFRNAAKAAAGFDHEAAVRREGLFPPPTRSRRAQLHATTPHDGERGRR